MAKLIFLTGPSGSGKSSTASAVATSWPSLCALINVDEIRTLIKSGYAEPAEGWNKETEKQWDIAKQVASAMAKTYIANDISVVLEVFATPHDYPTWKQLFESIEYRSFALMPKLETTIVRNNARTGIAKLKESDIQKNYKWSKWNGVEDMNVIDSTDLSLEQVVKQIIDLN